MTRPITRRTAFQLGVASLVAPPPADPSVPPRTFLTPAKDFQDVSRGTPLPHSLTGEALAKAGKSLEAQAQWKLAAALDLTPSERAELQAVTQKQPL